MKIAYCFCGHVRTYKETYENFFKNVYSQAPGDIYIHTWDETSNAHSSWWINMKGKQQFIEEAKKKIDVEDIIKIYQPKEILVETQRTMLPVPDWNLSWEPWALKVAWESVRKSVNMALKHGGYDRIFTQRMDFNWLTKFDTSELSRNTLCVAPHSQFLKQGACSDIWVHGMPEHINTVADWFFRIEEKVWYAPSRSVHGELAFHRYLKEMNIPISVSKLNFQVIRMFGQPPMQFPAMYNYTGTAE